MHNDQPFAAAVKRDFRHAVRLSLRIVSDLFHAAIELALARVRLSSRKSRKLLGSIPASAVSGPAPPKREDIDALVDRVSFAIPRMSSRVPWRADCLVQALAAQRWLGSRGVVSSIVVGVSKPMPEDFKAHAWLMAGDRIVTGDQADTYTTIFKQPSD